MAAYSYGMWISDTLRCFIAAPCCAPKAFGKKRISTIEDAILRETEQFPVELGAGFTFVTRQKLPPIDDDDFYMDLLF